MVSPKLIEIWKRTGRSEEWIQNKIAELTPTAEPVVVIPEKKTAKATRTRTKNKFKHKLSFWVSEKNYSNFETLMEELKQKNKSELQREIFKIGLSKYKLENGK